MEALNETLTVGGVGYGDGGAGWTPTLLPLSASLVSSLL